MPRYIYFIKRFTVYATLIIACFSIVGWLGNIEFLLSWVPDGATMKMNTAIMFLCLASSLYCYDNKGVKTLCLPFTSIGLLLSLYTSFSYLFPNNLPFDIDNLFIQDTSDSLYPGRPSLGTAFSFFCLFLSQLFAVSSFKRELSRKISFILNTIVLILAQVAFFAYLLWIELPERTLLLDTTALHTSILFIFHAFSGYFINPLPTTIEIFDTHFNGSKLFRRFLVLTAISSFFILFLHFILIRENILTIKFSSIVVTSLFIYIYAIFLFALAILLNKSEKEKDRIIHSLELKSEQNNLYLAKLQNKNRQLEEYAYVASHDLKQPLNNVEGLIKLLKGIQKKELSDEEYLNYLNLMESTILRGTTLIKKLLEYATLDLTIEKEYVSLNEILQETLIDLDQLISSKQAKIQIDSLPSVWCYPLSVRRLFQNLITNAINYTAINKTPEIHIKAESIRSTSETEVLDYVRIGVCDNGIGISEQDQQKIFTLFNRGAITHNHPTNNDTTVDNYSVGIGLAQCKKIAQMHNGSISVTSTLGEGSCFYVDLQNKKN